MGPDNADSKRQDALLHRRALIDGDRRWNVDAVLKRFLGDLAEAPPVSIAADGRTIATW